MVSEPTIDEPETVALTAKPVRSGVAAGLAVAVLVFAISNVPPQRGNREADTLLVMTGVSVLSTLAMIVYPALFRTPDVTATETAFPMGATSPCACGLRSSCWPVRPASFSWSLFDPGAEAGRGRGAPCAGSARHGRAGRDLLFNPGHKAFIEVAQVARARSRGAATGPRAAAPGARRNAITEER